MDKKILTFVKKVRGRIRTRIMADRMLTFLVAGFFVSVLVMLLALWVPIYYAIPISVGVVLLFLTAGIISGFRKTPTLVKAALCADAKGHKEKITTALELAGRSDAFSVLQKKDAVKVIDDFCIRKEFPIILSWKKSVLFVGLAVLFVVISLIDTPAKRIAITKHEVHKEALEEIAKLEKVQKELRKSDGIDKVKLSEVDGQIEQAKHDMRKADSIEDLKKAEDRITKKMEMSAETFKDASAKKALEKAVAQNKADQAKRMEEAMKEAEDAMAKAAEGNDKAKKEAYEKLEKAAQVSGDDALKQAADKYKQSDYSTFDHMTAANALKKAQSKNNNTDMAENSSGKQSGNANGSDDKKGGENGSNDQSGNSGSRSDSDKNGQNNKTGENKQEGNNKEQSGQQKSEGNNGQGNNGQSGQQGDQNGSGEGLSEGETGSDSGSNGNGSGPGWNRGSKTGYEGKAKVNENITVPEGEIGDDEDLSGKSNGNESSTYQKSSQANTWSGNKVSYGQVSGQYKDKAYKKVNGSSYPSKMKEKIRDYFDGLE